MKNALSFSQSQAHNFFMYIIKFHYLDNSLWYTVPLKIKLTVP